MRKIAIGLVIYNPNESLLQRLSLAIDAGFHIYIFDNSPDSNLVRNYCKSNEKCIYIVSGKNVGLGYGISSVCAQAYYDDYKALLFFDQDTIFNQSTLDYIESFYIRNKIIQTTYSAITFNSKNRSNKNEKGNTEVHDILMTINSGSLFYLPNLKKINWLNEKYFVDCVDYEFCLNSSNHGMKIGECKNTPGYDHDAEQGNIDYFFLGKNRKLRAYPLNRIMDTTSASTRLFFESIFSNNIKFTNVIARSITGYLFWQIFVRFIIIFNIKKLPK